ncbi:APC family permease [Salinisphaera sp. SPP-AMP-43]|uniref:APC family permease n=1 Tax=Salinisphaera sp. SPP-AMP-43 TaxID=3121288 RepID=UPI003C6E56BD
MTTTVGHSTRGHADNAARGLDALGYRPQLKRSMSFVDVVVYGLIYMVPMAPLAVFGVVYNFASGMVGLVYLVAATAMLFSALSYKEMAARYPVAGSVYSYIRLGINAYGGYLAGWAILLDYLLLPALLSVFAAVAMAGILPGVPAWVWIVVFVGLATGVNLGGIGVTAAMNKLFLGLQLLVIAAFVVIAGCDIVAGHIALSWRPLFDASMFSWSIVFGAVPIAALSFLGFDAIATLNEEAQGGGRTVSRATLVVLCAATLLFVGQVYLAALYVPEGTRFAAGSETHNAFYNIAEQAAGHGFRVLMTLTSALIAIFANSIASQATSARLVFSMARDRQLPSLLARVDRNHTPRNATLFIAGLSLVIGLFGSESPEVLTTLVTFGALTAYILLHAAVLFRFMLIERSRRWILHGLSPIVGGAILIYALIEADTQAQMLGAVWMLGGVLMALVVRRRSAGMATTNAAQRAQSG